MELEVSRVEPGAPELLADDWRELGASTGFGEYARTTLLASVETFSNDFYGVTAWSPGRARRLAYAVAFVAKEGAKRSLMVVHPLLINTTTPRGIYIAPGEDVVTTCRALLTELARLAAKVECRYMFLSAPRHIAGLDELFRELGFGGTFSRGWHSLSLPPGTTAERYLERLEGQWRRNFRLGLRSVEKSGSRIEHASRPEPDQLVQMWNLQREMYARKDEFLRVRDDANLFASLLRYRGVVADEVTLCLRGNEVLAYTLTDHLGTISIAGLVGHATVDDFNAYAAVTTHMVLREIARGAESIHFGDTNDDYKRRLGCEASTLTTYFGRA
jgi:hypothetical protein